MFIGNVLAKWAAAGGQLLPRIAMSPFSRTAAFWIPWRTPEASCLGKEANTAIPGAVLVVFCDRISGAILIYSTSLIWIAEETLA